MPLSKSPRRIRPAGVALSESPFPLTYNHNSTDREQINNKLNSDTRQFNDTTYYGKTSYL